MVEAQEIRGWSLKVREEPLSTSSSRNESCYLILLSTLLRFIRQLFDALQYATNRARIVCRRVVLSFPLSVFPSCLHSLSLLQPLSFPVTAYTYQTTCIYMYLYFYVYTILSNTFSRSVTSSNLLRIVSLQILLLQSFTNNLTMIILGMFITINSLMFLNNHEIQINIKLIFQNQFISFGIVCKIANNSITHFL